MNNKIIDLFIKNIEQDQKLRNRYATILIGSLIGLLVALVTIFILNGIGILNYSETTFNIFITGGIAEVFVLVRIIVKYLFKDNLTEALKIIIESNNSKQYRKGKNIKKSDKPRE